MKLILSLSGDISFNPGPNRENHQLTDNLEAFKICGLHFTHLNINCLLTKPDELRKIGKTENVVPVGITESKLDTQ